MSRPHSLPLLFALLLILPLLVTGTPAVQAQAPAPDSVIVTAPLSNVTAIAAGGRFTCALLGNGTVRCWGQNNAGQLGDGSTAQRAMPVAVTGVTNAVAIAAGDVHACAVLATGGVRCWGANGAGQLGNNSLIGSPTPVSVSGLNNAVAITAGLAHTCALTATGGVRCWGFNGNGGLGDGSNINRSTPVAVTGLGAARAVVAGFHHSCALLTTGSVSCWGQGTDGQLGNGTFVAGNSPVTVLDAATLLPLTGAISISAGSWSDHNCVRLDSSGLKCWGKGLDGQLGDANNLNRSRAVDVSGHGSATTAVGAGGYHTCAVMSGNGYCWGLNGAGQLGDGSQTSINTSVQVVGLGGPVAAISGGAFHTCALLAGGLVQCWGAGDNGQLGNGLLPAAQKSPVWVMSDQSCYRLSLTATGSGSVPQVTPQHSPGCPQAHYTGGALLSLLAGPAANQRVQGWSSIVSGAAGSQAALLVMPGADSTAGVTYAPCLLLTLNHTGSGANPQPAPSSSVGCAPNRFVAGERLALTALPAANMRVKSWSGASATPGAALQVNTVTMPAANHTAAAAYEPCLALSAAFDGQGTPPQFEPVASMGCAAAATFAQGDTIVVRAQPASGWMVAGWSGTTNNASTAATNTVVMGASSAQVRVIYAAAQQKVFLPLTRR